MDVVSVVKQHPLAIAGGVVVLLLIMGASKGGSGGASSVMGATLQSQSIATQGNVQMAGINADVTKARISAAAAEAAQRTSIIGQIFQTELTTSAQLAGMNVQKNLQSTLGYLQHADNKQAMENQLALGMRQIDAGTQQTAAKLSAMLQAQAQSGNTQLQGLALQLQSGERVGAAQIDYLKSRDAITAANLPTLLAHSENMSKIAASNAQAIANINTQAARTAANVNAAGAGMDIFSQLFSMFSGGSNSGNSGGGGGGFDWGDAAKIAAAFFA